MSDKKKVVLIVLLILFFSVLQLGVILIFSNYVKLQSYKDVVYPNTYLGNYKISDVSFDYLEDRVNFYSKGILDSKVIFKDLDREYKYSFSDLGFKINTKDIVLEIINDQKNNSLFENIDRVNGKNKKVYQYKIEYDKSKIEQVLLELKTKADRGAVDDGLSVSPSRIVSYVPGSKGFSLDVSKTVDLFLKEIDKYISGNIEVDLQGEFVEYNSNDNYKMIDTKVSSFVTEFNPYITRATNLKTALGYIDGAIVMPGEVFSFYKYAGPYNKRGYVFYYEFVGNGVCQIATTVYNTALLGGLEIVKRYPHKAKSVYVDGGLDATVASYASGWNVDFQFKNTYKYPIYISAYADGGEAHVDFWSNHDAKEGKTYSTESVKIGYRGYNTYLHTYKDGVEIDKKFIATTWYSED